MGLEGSGIVESLGEGVTGIAAGDRVAYAGISSVLFPQVRRSK
ncbi:MAG: hypothetical protein DRP87_09685 [Spirochaetes bacterium]|nr:MAG: hypothetical protein DRP87_09685 [Spirochaetota bacterium]